MAVHRSLAVVIGLLAVLALAAIIAVAVLASRLAEKDNGDNMAQEQVSTETVDFNTCDDISIIGAGITGSYSAWRMRDRNLTISVYEYSNRIGGRCFTVKLPGIPDVNVEMGAMRFKPNDHTLLNKTITDLGLDIVDFELGYGGGGNTLYYLRGSHLKYDELHTKAPYQIPDKFKVDFDTLFWDLYNNFTQEKNGVSKGNYSAENRQRIETIDGVELGNISRRIYDAMYLDSETSQYYADANSFRSESAGLSAANWLPVSDPSLSSGSNPVKTVKQGFQKIPTTMIEEFLAASTKHAFHRNHHLKSIQRHANKKYILTFQPTETLAGITSEIDSEKPIVKCAKKVVLAIPRLPLQQLDWEGLKQDNIKDILDHAVQDVVGGKTFFGYDTPWYRDTPLGKEYHYAISTTPLRQTYDFAVSNSTGKAVLNPFYTDYTVPFWRDVKDAGPPLPTTDDGNMQLAMSNTSVNLVRKFYAEVFNLSVDEVPIPKSAVMRLWDEYPFGAVWYDWSPGYNWGETNAIITQPSKSDDVFVASNTFSANQLSDWTEGGLRQVERMLKLI